MRSRPTVSVIVPFAGPTAALIGVLDALAQVRTREGDELVIADNRRGADARGSAVEAVPDSGLDSADSRVRLCRAPALRSPGYARNCAAASATGEWLIFIDADTRPVPSLLDDYFEPQPGERTAVLAGGIEDVPGSGRLAARHSVARGQMSQRMTLTRRGTPYAQSANCAVLRRAFGEVGGFDEQILSGEDADLCFRLERAGWKLEERPAALVQHWSRPTTATLLRQLARHGSGASWLNRRYPGEFPSARPREIVVRAARACAAFGRAAARGDREAAGFALLDIATMGAFEAGRVLSNRAKAAD